MKEKIKKIILFFGILGLIFLICTPVSAHRSGCHRWHSCPSDSGSYTCGDLGYPCQYPTYPASGGVIYPPSGYYKDCYDCPLKKVPSNNPKASQIQSEIEKVKSDYYKNPHWFRENLINKLKISLNINLYATDYNILTYYIYSMLSDIK